MQAYLIEFDNGQDWEDHSRDTLAVALDRAVAEQRTATLTAWLARTRNRLPPAPSSEQGDEDFAAAATKREAALARVRVPYGAHILRSALDKDGGTFHVTPVPLEKAK